ncbi:MAG: chemotaxis protein CheX [Gallionellaceae bacterium]
MVQARKKSSKSAQIESVVNGKQVDKLMIAALLESLSIIFATMVNLKINAGVPVTKQGSSAKGDVTGLIGMQAKGVSASVALTLTLPAIRAISFKLFGEEIASINKEATELVGELTNMLAGGAKRILSEQGHDFDMQTPQLLAGQGHDIVHLSSGQTVWLPIAMEQDECFSS